MADITEITEILSSALENISKESLKNFKRRLCAVRVPSPYKRIPSSSLDDRSAREVVDAIIRYYTINDGPKITIQVLQDINERQVSSELEESIHTVYTKKPGVDEVTPRNGPVITLGDATNRMSSSHDRRALRQNYREENLSSETSENRIYQKGKQTKNVNRRLDMTTAENQGEASENQGGASVLSRPKRQCRPDMQLAYLTATDLQLMAENHDGKAHRFACFLFKHFVRFEEYQTWTKNTNFDGRGEKYAIPDNLRRAILTEIRKEFSLTQNDKRQIKRAINELLSRPRLSGWPILI